MSIRRLRNPAWCWLTACAALLCTGCAHYALDTPGELPFRTVYVEPVKNRSYAPQAQELLTRQLITDLRQAGVTTVGSPAGADATLSVTLVDLNRVGLATQADDTGLAASYLLVLEADCTLLARDGTPHFEARRILAREQVFLDSGQQPAEFQAMPVLTRTLAGNIADAVTSTW
ncbi:MAG: LPS assembly lipoprotein LptE [Opitutales bacterium]